MLHLLPPPVALFMRKVFIESDDLGHMARLHLDLLLDEIRRAERGMAVRLFGWIGPHNNPATRPTP